MSKVYVVFKKEYDGDHIVEIASTEVKAKEICSKVNDIYEPAYFVEYDVA